MKRQAIQAWGAALLLASLPAFAQWGGNEQIDIRPRRTNDYDDRRDQGYCIVRVRVDIEADVMLQGDRISVRWYGGQPSRDEGTECSQPLPGGRNIRDFQFKGMDGRGEVRLVEQPGDRNGGRAVVKIRDTKGGSEGYTFRLQWSGTPGGGSWDGGGGWGGSGGSGGGSGLTTTRGSGSMRQDGVSPDPQFEEMRVDLRGSDFTIELRGRNTFVDLKGTYRRSGDRYDLEIRDGFRSSGADGRGELRMRNGQVDRFSADGSTRRNNRRFEIRFSQSGSGGDWGGGGGSGWGDGGSGGNVNANASGRGSFYVGNGRAQDITDARVEVRNGSDGMVELRGRGTVAFYGRVSSRNRNELVIRVNRFVQTDAEGEVRVRFRDSSMRDIEEIRVEGRARNGNDFRGDFRR
jgi:hypothetical protein